MARRARACVEAPRRAATGACQASTDVTGRGRLSRRLKRRRGGADRRGDQRQAAEVRSSRRIVTAGRGIASGRARPPRPA